MYIFNIPSMIKNPAETDVPIIPPILLNAPNLELIAEAVAATTMEVIMTMLFEEKNDQYSFNLVVTSKKTGY